jgi:DNA-binding PadR family transcriptional regulator
MASPPDINESLPVRPSALAVLASLAEGPQPGFDILERANEAVPGHPLLGPGTLYRVLRELRQEGLIERAQVPDGATGAGDERVHYHRLTAFGRAVLRAESVRLRRTLEQAGELRPEPGHG